MSQWQSKLKTKRRFNSDLVARGICHRALWFSAVQFSLWWRPQHGQNMLELVFKVVELLYKSFLILQLNSASELAPISVLKIILRFKFICWIRVISHLKWCQKMPLTGVIKQSHFCPLQGAFHILQEINSLCCFTAVFVLSVGQEIS